MGSELQFCKTEFCGRVVLMVAQQHAHSQRHHVH